MRQPSRLWWLAVAGAWLMLAGSVMLASLIGPFILFVGPVLALSGACLLSFVHGKVDEPPTCDACGKIAAPIAHAAEQPTRDWQLALAQAGRRQSVSAS